MNDLRTAAQQALEAMSSFENGTGGLYEGEFSAEIAALRAALAESVQDVVTWDDAGADADAARLAMELEALLLDTKDMAVVSRWWQSAHDALDLHRERLADAQREAS